MNSVREFVDTGAEWLDLLPVDWRVAILGRESWVRARLGWKGLKAEEYVDEGGFPMLSTPDIKSRDIDFGSAARITDARFKESPEIMLRVGDVLLTKDGSTIGTVNIVRDLPEPTTLNGSIALLTPSKNLSGQYLYYVIASRYAQALFERLRGGAGVPHLFQRDINQIRIPLPPLDEQRAIADYLDQETAQIDALVVKQEKFRAKLIERRIALISDAVIKGLEPGVPRKPSGADWFDSVPSHWHVGRLKNSVMDAQVGVWGSDPVGDGADVLCVRVADFERPLLRVGEAETMRAVSAKDARPRLLRRGDLLLEKSGGTLQNPVGFVAMYEDDRGPAVASNFISRLRLHDDQDSRYWLYAHATSYGTRLTARSVKQTTGIQNLNQASYFNELFPYPPVEEQREIAAFLDKQTSRIDTLIAKAEEHISLAKERRAALITAAVTGQIDVRTAAQKAS